MRTRDVLLPWLSPRKDLPHDYAKAFYAVRCRRFALKTPHTHRKRESTPYIRFHSDVFLILPGLGRLLL